VLDRRSAPAMYTILASETLPAGGPDEVGNKAWNLMRMTLAGLPVPPAFVLSTGWCQAMRQGRVDTSELGAMLHDGIGRLERAIGLAFGSGAGHCWSRSARAPPFRCQE
jgi:hypothetical protein